MAQCTKILERGERCSNRAVPGSEYCEQHRKISFRKISKPSPPPEAPKNKKTGRVADTPQWVARPSAAGEQPAFPGLHADERNILVAPQGLIRLDERQEKPTGTLFDRLVKLLACLSQDLPLPGSVTVSLLPEGRGALLRLRPPSHEQTALSRHYDTASAAAALSGGCLYIGEERAFIRYRDDGAPRGYDADGVTLPKGTLFFFTDLDGTEAVSPDDMQEQALAELLLRIAPLPLHGAAVPDVAFALAAPPLYKLLARYFRDHYLRYRVARFLADGSQEPSPAPSQKRNGELLLFEIRQRPDAPAGRQIPKFVLSYLQELPRCVLLTETGMDGSRRMLVEWGQHYPCLAQHIQEAFAPDSLLLFMRSPDFPNLSVSPAPAFFEGDELIAVQAPRTIAQAEGCPDQQEDALDVPLRLVPGGGPTPATSALVLDDRETEWLRRLLYRLPGDAFGAYTLCRGEGRSVLLSEEMPVESLPFGVPLRRMQDSSLFLPLRARLLPELSWNVLAEVLNLRPEVYTFLLPEFRFDLPRSAFAPLSRSLTAGPAQSRIDFALRPMSTYPALHWDEKPADASRQKAPNQKQKTRGGKQKKEHRGNAGKLAERMHHHIASPETSGSAAHQDSAPQAALQDVEALLRDKARAYREEGEYLSAAQCFLLAGDTVEAAHCYHEAARTLVNVT